MEYGHQVVLALFIIIISLFVLNIKPYVKRSAPKSGSIGLQRGEVIRSMKHILETKLGNISNPKLLILLDSSCSACHNVMAFLSTIKPEYLQHVCVCIASHDGTVDDNKIAGIEDKAIILTDEEMEAYFKVDAFPFYYSIDDDHTILDKGYVEIPKMPILTEGLFTSDQRELRVAYSEKRFEVNEWMI